MNEKAEKAARERKMIGRMQGLVLVAGMVIHSAPAPACSIAVPSCVSEVNGRESQRVDELQESTNVVIFVERAADSGALEKLFLVDCRSRQGVSAPLPEGVDFANPVLQQSIDFLVEAAASDRPYTLTEIKDQLMVEGLHARVSRLPEGHCGCSLPEMEVPACPVGSSG